jgi:DNA repair photolyase
MKKIRKKSLLYKSKVEYGSWTINHIEGCSHGCKFPCYAYMMAKRFGKIRTYEEWREPKIVENSIELLKKEIIKYKNRIDFVHLSFTTDPFMYDFEKNILIPEVKKLTLKIIKFLNENNIRVTTLTKGYYPDELLTNGFLSSNEYGITLVSLNPEFKEKFEPFSAPYEMRVSSLEKLALKGLDTWVSIEPYPTPNLDHSAYYIENLLEKIYFVKKIVFGKLNYNVKSNNFTNNKEFYKTITDKIIQFAESNNIEHHIKFGTPNSKKKTAAIFKKNIIFEEKTNIKSKNSFL